MEKIPKHIAIIPDGNRRWAKKHNLSAWLGHKKGSENLENLLDILIQLNIPHFSFWGSSKDNMSKRPKEEVAFLLKTFKENFQRLSVSEKIHKNEVKINIFGSWEEQFPEDVKEPMKKAIECTKNYNKHFLNFFIAYSGTDEIIDAIKKTVELSAKDVNVQIDKALFKSQLLTKDLLPVDLLIRTGGEPHNSDGFMMWEVANAQLTFLEKLWPDFNNEDLKNAILEYSSRERRWGK